MCNLHANCHIAVADMKIVIKRMYNFPNGISSNLCTSCSVRRALDRNTNQTMTDIASLQSWPSWHTTAFIVQIGMLRSVSNIILYDRGSVYFFVFLCLLIAERRAQNGLAEQDITAEKKLTKSLLLYVGHEGYLIEKVAILFARHISLYWDQRDGISARSTFYHLRSTIPIFFSATIGVVSKCHFWWNVAKESPSGCCTVCKRARTINFSQITKFSIVCSDFQSHAILLTTPTLVANLFLITSLSTVLNWRLAAEASTNKHLFRLNSDLIFHIFPPLQIRLKKVISSSLTSFGSSFSKHIRFWNSHSCAALRWKLKLKRKWYCSGGLSAVSLWNVNIDHKCVWVHS